MIVYTDGGSRNNPGNAAIGIVLCDDKNNVLTTYKEFIGKASNNVAEYSAVIKALEMLSHRAGENLEFFSDSQLMVMQLNGVYKVKNAGIKKLYDRVMELRRVYGKVVFNHVPREHPKIVIADRIVNEALDES